MQTYKIAAEVEEKRGVVNDVRASTPEMAIDRFLLALIQHNALQVPALPVDFIIRDEANSARRFRCELVTLELPACRVCACTDDRACDPPCSWADDDLCDNPSCLEAAGAVT